MKYYNGFKSWLENRCKKQFLAICIDMDGNVFSLEEFSTLQEAQEKMSRIWAAYSQVIEDGRELELKRLPPNGFIADGYHYFILTTVNPWRSDHE